MKIVHITDRSFSSAPARGVLGLHRALIGLGHESEVLTGARETEEPAVSALADESGKGRALFRLIQESELDENPAHLLSSFFTLGYPGCAFLQHPAVQNADVIHLHDVKQTLSPVEIHGLVRAGKRVVWSLPDAAPFTGGCHCPVDCKKFTADCRACPQLLEDRLGAPAEILADKRETYGLASGGNFALTAPNRWLAESAEKSAALLGHSVRVVAPAVDRQQLQLFAKTEARERLGLPTDGFILLIQAEETGRHERGRQSIRDLIEFFTHFNSLRRLARDGKFAAVVLGVEEGFTHPTFPVHCWRAADFAHLSLILSAARLAAFPRVEENNSPAISELARCGTPAIAYAAMGLGEHITEGRTGRVVRPWEPRRMAEEISLLALQPETLAQWSAECRAWAELQNSTEKTAHDFLEIYNGLTPAEPAPAPGLRPAFQKFCIESLDTLLTEASPPVRETYAAAEAATKHLKTVVMRASDKISLMERRLDRFKEAAKNSDTDDFSKAFTSLQKLRGSLLKALRFYDRKERERGLGLPARPNLRRDTPQAPPAAQKPLPRPLESWLATRIAAAIGERAVKNLGVLDQYPPRPLTLETFPKPTAFEKNLPLIAVVTPSFMQGHFIEETITSVIGQNYPRLRYAVQDAGSTDETVGILQKHAGAITTWSSSPDTGQARAIRDGFGKISGDIMAWLNSDDTLLPGALRFVGEYFEKHPGVDAVYGHRVIINEHSQEIGRWVMPPHDPEFLRWADYVPQETLFWRAELWQKVGGIDPSFRFAMDWDLLLRFTEAGANIVRVPYFLGCFRVHTQQKTSAQMDTVGADEVTYLRLRTRGEHPEPAEWLRRLGRERRRSALYAALLKYGIRL